MMPQTRFHRAFAALSLLSLLLLPALPVVAAERAAPPAWRNDPAVVVAELALQQGKCREGAEAYLKATLASADVSLASHATQVGLGCQQLATAQAAGNRWQALAPRAGDAALARTLVALKLYRVDQARQALSAWHDSPTAGNQDPGRFAQLLETESESTAVHGIFADVILNDNSNAEVVMAAATLALHAYDLRRAVQLAERALTIEPQMLQAKLLAARARALLGETDAALASVRAVQEQLSDDDVFLVADLLASADRGEQARTELLRLREDARYTAAADRRLGGQALEQGDEAEAEKRFTSLLAQRGSSGMAMLALSQLAERRGDLTRALRGYALLAESGMGLVADNGAARVLLLQGQEAKALELLDLYIEAHPDNAIEALVARSHLRASKGDAAAAVADLDAALRKYPAHPTLAYQRATMLERAGRHREAVTAFEAQLQERPGDPNVANALGYTLADNAQRLDRAEQLIRQALAVSPDNPAIQDSLGWIHYRRGRLAQALPVLEQAWRTSRDAEIGAHFGEVLWKKGDEGRAHYVWAQALNRDPVNALVLATRDRLTAAPAAKKSR